ncbi:gamma-glutamyltransferase, partial [Candidatus Poribacteria bacterium]|nr:gamma-glutamyltransferase [Candidatus Poribacteria bacterium]
MKGAVAAGSPGTARAAAEVLRDGGNAVDAALAGLFATFAAEFFFSNPGGSGVATVREPDGRVVAYDFFSTMPGLGRGGPPANLDFRPVKLEYGGTHPVFHIGRGSVALPGNIKGISVLHRKYGTRRIESLIAPAIELARGGVALKSNHLEVLRVLSPIFTDTDEGAGMLGGRGNVCADPSCVRLEVLAGFLSRLREEGLESFYSGAMAELMVADQETNGGLLTSRDLSEYEVLELEPNRVALDGWEVFTPPLPSMGGVMVTMMLHLWRETGRRAGFPSPDSPGTAHRWGAVIGAVNAAREDIERHISGEDSSEFRYNPLVERLVEPILEAITSQRPSPPARLRRFPGNTTHISVVDETGMAVAITTSPGESAGYLVPGLGTMMNNM